MRYALCLLALILPLSAQTITTIYQEGSFDSTVRKQINDNFAALNAVSTNAKTIQGTTVCSTAPTDTQVLTYSLADGCWEPANSSGGSLTGTGVAGVIPLWSSASVLTTSALSDDGTNVTSTEPLVVSNGTSRGVATLKEGTAPSAPASGFASIYVNSTTGQIACLDSSSVNCLPIPQTPTNCSSGASPAVCGANAAGAVAIATGTTSETLTVATTAVHANSQIFLQVDSTLGTKLSVTCNSTLATLVGGLAVTARTAGTSFEITHSGDISTNPLCLSYVIVN